MASPSPAAAAFAAIADELGDLERELAPLKSKIARSEVLRKLLRAAYAGEAADKSFIVDGAKWSVQLGAKGNESVVDKPKLFDLVGPAVALNICTVPLKALESFSADVRAAVVSTHATGTRPIHLFPAPAPVAPTAPVKKAAVKRARRSQ